MRITWKDGVTTLAMGGAVLLERAYFWEWDWPLISSMRWTIVGLAALLAIGYVFSYVLDEDRSTGWTLTTGVLASATLVLAVLGVAFVVSDYVVLLMINAVVFWVASIARHLTVPSSLTHSHAS